MKSQSRLLQVRSANVAGSWAAAAQDPHKPSRKVLRYVLVTKFLSFEHRTEFPAAEKLVIKRRSGCRETGECYQLQISPCWLVMGQSAFRVLWQLRGGISCEVESGFSSGATKAAPAVIADLFFVT